MNEYLNNNYNLSIYYTYGVYKRHLWKWKAISFINGT